MPERPTPNPDMVQHAADVQGMNLQFELLDLDDKPGAVGDVLTSRGDLNAPVWRMGTIGAADMISPGHPVKPGDVVIFSGKSGRTVESAGVPFTPEGLGAARADHTHPMAGRKKDGFMSHQDYELLHHLAQGVATPATTTDLGVIIVGDNLTVEPDGRLSAQGGGKKILGHGQPFPAAVGTSRPILREANAIGVRLTLVARGAMGQTMVEVEVQSWNGQFSHVIYAEQMLGTGPVLDFVPSDNNGQLEVGLSVDVNLVDLRGLYLPL